MRQDCAVVERDGGKPAGEWETRCPWALRDRGIRAVIPVPEGISAAIG
jgi:hypothetical protein